MKIVKKIRFLILGVSLLSFCFPSGFALQVIGNSNSSYQILNQNADNIVEDVGNDAWRKGSRDAINSQDGNYKIDNLINADTEITSQSDAHGRVLRTIWRFVNRALGFISLISLGILIFAGVKMVMGAGDEKAQGEGKAAFLKIARAVAGIALSWMIISFIFWVINAVLFK